MFLKLKSAVCLVISTVIAFLGSHGMWSNQIESVQSIQKVTDGFYTMDYTYDYDVDDMLRNGMNTHIRLFLANMAKIAFDVKGFGCTTFNSVNSDGEYLLSRNFDYMDSDYLLVWTHPEDGYESLSSVSLYFFGYNDKFVPEDELTSLMTLLAPYAPLDGINEKGLSIGVLELEKAPTFQLNLFKKSLTTTSMIRAVLDKAATVDEAIAIFEKYNMRDLLFVNCTYHYQIADAKGNTAVIEYVNGKMNVLRPAENKKSKVDWLTAANYYMVPGVDDPLGTGWERTDIVKKELTASKGVTSEKKAMNILKQCSMRDADLHGYICSTLWSSVYNTHDKTVNVCFYGDYGTTYKYSVSKPQQNLG